MTLKSLAVITLVVFGCRFAAAQTFGFLSVGLGVYCNYEQLHGPVLFSGFDNLSECGVSHNATIVGLLATVPKSEGLPVSGKGVIYADNLYDAYSYTYTGSQWLVYSLLKCSSKHYGWIGFAGYNGLIFGDNYGYLSCKIPGKGAVATKGVSWGKFSKAPVKK